MLAISVRLRDGRYDAAVGWQEAEWPPHPARLFCALVASARDERDWAVLQKLESAPPPEVWAAAPEDVRSIAHTGFVVTNRTKQGGGNQFWPGRENNLRTRATAFPPDDGFAFVWANAPLDTTDRDALEAMARRVPYLGRTTSPVVLSVGLSIEPRDGWRRFSCTGSATGRFLLRVPYPGYVDRLCRAYEEGLRAWEVERVEGYALAEVDTPAVMPYRSPFEDLIVFGFRRPVVAPAGAHVLRFTDVLRRGVLARVPDPPPSAVSGHGADGRCHVAFLGLLDVGHPHADGHLLGLAVALPEMTTADRQAVLHGLLSLERLTFGRGGILELEYDAFRSMPWGLLPERWTASPEGSAVWSTVTPLVLDRFPKARTNTASEVATSLARAGFPSPVEVEVSRTSFTSGGVARLAPACWPAGRPRRPTLHCRVRFSEPVVGPVVAGSLRYLGAGLFAPDGEGS